MLVGIALLFGGGELFVQGAVTLALIFGIPQLVIGLTVVSLGTSAPEFFVSLGSVLQGSDALAVSNAVGSNIFNVMVVLGSSALVLPLKVESRLVRRDVPLLLAVSAAVWGMASTGRITWQSGVALLLALVINTIGRSAPRGKNPRRWKTPSLRLMPKPRMRAGSRPRSDCWAGLWCWALEPSSWSKAPVPPHCSWA